MFKTVVLATLLALLPLFAMADTPYVDLEQRLSADQLRATGLDTLSPEQLVQLNAVLRAEVEIAPGMAGRWFFHVDEDLPGARVYRVD